MNLKVFGFFTTIAGACKFDATICATGVSGRQGHLILWHKNWKPASAFWTRLPDGARILRQHDLKSEIVIVDFAPCFKMNRDCDLLM